MKLVASLFAKQQDNIDYPALHDNNHNFDIGDNCNFNGNYIFDYDGRILEFRRTTKL